ncbi:ANTAR domain-containing protein [Rhodococcus sp. NPDC019627]|uniref:ANTAR domain-containing protein n=1 Tax=unclassified Rhodococcus (in: high G+C Gram-positive bacteria) TaxID=192944 RepID=UPI0033E54B7F
MTEVPDTGDTPALEPADATDKRRMDGRQLLSTAKGIVIALRGCSDTAAFDETCCAWPTVTTSACSTPHAHS